jgi:hypothetical protein
MQALATTNGNVTAAAKSSALAGEHCIEESTK